MSAAAAKPQPLRPTILHLALLVPWVALVINSFESITDNSYLWHIRAGTVQEALGSVLTTDPFSISLQGEPWRTQSWLPELAYGWMESLTGLAFTAPMLLLMSALLFVVIGLLGYQFSRSVMSTVVILILSAVIMPRFLVPRPVLFGLLLFALVAIAWEQKRLRWALPFLFWIWAATHGSFVIGLAYLGLRTLQRREWKSVPTVAMSAIATLLTAHGLGVVSMLIDFFEVRSYLQYISEWQRTNLLEPDLLPFIVLFVVVAWGMVSRRVKIGELWIVLPFAALALMARRSVAFSWVALVPVFAQSLGPISSRWARGLPRAAAALAAVSILVFPFLIAQSGRLDEDRFPVAAADHLTEGNTFHGVAVGGYLIYRSGPEIPVFIDDRVELFGPRIPEVVEVELGLQDWEPVFERDGIEQALVRVEDPMADVLEDEGWSARYRDDNFVVLVP